MSLLSDAGIKRAIAHGDIVIAPYKDQFLAPVGYYLHVGKWVADLTAGTLLQPIPDAASKRYKVLPGHRILILTHEVVGVSPKIGGTFHTMVELVADGFSSISTTLDPGWVGGLWVTITNTSDKELELAEGASFTKLVFYRVRPQAMRRNPQPQPLNDVDKLYRLMHGFAGTKIWTETLNGAFDEARQAVADTADKVATARKRLRESRTIRRIQLAAAIVLIALEVVPTVAFFRATNESDQIGLGSIIVAVLLIVVTLLLQPWQLRSSPQSSADA